MVGLLWWHGFNGCDFQEGLFSVHLDFMSSEFSLLEVWFRFYLRFDCLHVHQSGTFEQMGSDRKCTGLIEVVFSLA